MEKSMKRIISITSLVIAVLLLFTTCGIQRRFRWERNNEYTITNGAICFNLSYASDDEVHHLDPKNGFPRLYFFYAIAPQTGLVSGNASSSLISQYNSQFVNTTRNIIPNTTINVGTDDPPISTVTVYPIDAVGSSTTSSRIGLYEFVDAEKPNLRPQFPDSLDSFPVDTQTRYDRTITYSISTVEYEEGFAIQLTLNPNTSYQMVYTLLRTNGEPFMTDISYYIEEQGRSEKREFDYNDAASYFQMPSIYIYASCSFAYNGYTSVSTIPLTIVDSQIAF